jgi:endonuclease/exonuclease/phosphatase family metal-dependent hydrolase
MQKIIKKAAIGMGVMLLSATTLAESYIYLTNNTNQTLDLTINQRGSSLVKGEHWWQLASSVPPLGTVRFLETNRDSGIKWGSDYYFDTTVTAEDGSTAMLQQKLTGTWNFSDIWHGTQQSSWYDDRDIHSVSQSFAGSQSTIAFKAEAARANGDDYYYVIHPTQETAQRSTNNNLNVMAYNVWALLPGIVSTDVSERLNLIVDKVKGYDAIVFSELFDNDRRETFLHALSTEYPYQTSVVDESGSLEDGGVLIISRWPIETESQITFNSCDAEDCLSSKGVIYAQINKNGNPYHLFGTHTQAWNDPVNQSTRLSQFHQMRNFIDSRNISTDAPVIIAGDLNVDSLNYQQEYNTMLSVLNAAEVPRNGGYAYSYNGHINNWTDGGPENLDYVLYSTAHRQPIASEAKVLTPRSIHADVFTKYDLSDHFAITANLTFDTPEGSITSPIGTSWTQQTGNMRQVSTAADGTTWATDANDGIFRLNGSTWEQIPGGLMQVSVGASGVVWGVNRQQYIYRYNGDGQGWTAIPGQLKNVSVGADGTVWGTSSNDSIYRWNGSGWNQISGALRDVSVGSSSQVWGVNNQNMAFRWTNSGWVHVSNNIQSVSVASDGTVWALDPQNNIFQYSTSGIWTSVSGALNTISVGSAQNVMGTVVASENLIFKRDFN